MPENDNKTHLLKSPIFSDLPSDSLDELARSVENMTVGPKHTIFREGEPAEYFYIIASGRVRVFVKHEKGVERELSILGPGDSFGEVALLTAETRTATVQSLEPTELMTISKEQFDSLLEKRPEIAKKFMKDMRSWLIKDQAIIEEEAQAAFQATRMSWSDFFLIIGVSILLALSFNHSNPNGVPLIPETIDAASVPAVSPAVAMDEVRSNQALIVDAMPANFFQKGHIKGAVSMPMALFDIVYLMNFSEENKEKPVLVYGSTISKPYALEIAGKLMLHGYTNVKIIEGGLTAWLAQGYPVEESSPK